MKRLVLANFATNPTVLLDEGAKLPEQLSDDQVLIKMEAATINGSDLMMINQMYAVRPEIPHGLGGEGVGRVEKAGKNAQHLVGKRVVIPPTYDQWTWAEYAVASQHTVIDVGDKADVLQLAMLGVNPPTAYLLLKKYDHLMPGDWIGQTGANSAAAQYVIQLAKLAGVKSLNIVRSEEAAEQVRQLGGDKVVIQGDDLQKQIKEALGSEKLSVVFDAIGGTAIGALMKFVKHGGAGVIYGLVSGQPQQVSPLDMIFNDLGLHGLWMVTWIKNAPRDEVQTVYKHLASLIEEGKLRSEVAATYTLDQYLDAFNHARQGSRNGKIIFRF